MSVTQRQEAPIRRAGRKAGEQQQRASQPGTYDRAYSTLPEQPKPWIKAPAFAHKTDAPVELVERARWKLALIQRFVRERCPRGQLSRYARLAAIAQGLPAEGIPPYTTLITWVHQYLAHGFVGLIDAVRADGGASTLTDEQQRIALAAYLGGKHSYAGAARFVAKHTALTEQAPSAAVVRRFIKAYEVAHPHLVVLCRKGKLAYRNESQLALSRGILLGGDTYAIDSTLADRWVRVPDSERGPGYWRPARVVLTVVEDVGSSALLTFNLSLVSVDSGIMLGTMRRVVDPDAQFIGLHSPGLPDRILVDAGSEFLGAFDAAMVQQGVEVLRGPGNSPERNGRVERLIRTITTEVLANRVGYSPVHQPFSLYAPPEDDAKRNMRSLRYEPYRLDVPIESLSSVEELEAEILAWVTLYNQRPHPALRLDSSAVHEALLEAERWESEWQRAA